MDRLRLKILYDHFLRLHTGINLGKQTECPAVAYTFEELGEGLIRPPTESAEDSLAENLATYCVRGRFLRVSRLCMNESA